MTDTLETDVIIVGGGPVGLAAAMDLNLHGVKSVIVERRAYLEAPNVKCNHVSARTMERFRQFGLADKVRNAGLPSTHPQDVTFKVSIVGEELSRIPIPSRNARFTSQFGPDTSWATPEPPHRINQRFMEPVMMEHVASLEHVTLLNERNYIDFTQDDFGVEVRTERIDGAEPITIRGRYMIGADGSSSRVRKQIGSQLSGDAVLSHVQSTCIRAKGLSDLISGPPAWGYYTFNPERSGHVYAIDGQDVFLVHTYITEEEAAAESVDRDRAIRTILGVDEEFNYEVLSKEDWVARRLVVDNFRDRKVFIAGDACHLWVPYAGYGMNAGVADVLNLTWLLSARLSGWAEESILDAYETERRPITQQVSEFVKRHQRKIAQGDVPVDIAADTESGARARALLGRTAYELNVKQFAAEGLNFGYFYDASPIISYDEKVPPAFTMGEYTPSTVPGCRAPHFWLSDTKSLYDELGLGYSIIARDDTDGLAPLLEAADFAKVPLKVITFPGALMPEEYTHKFTLVRPDQHVVWRGDTSPSEPSQLISLIRGALAV